MLVLTDLHFQVLFLTDRQLMEEPWLTSFITATIARKALFTIPQWILSVKCRKIKCPNIARFTVIIIYHQRIQEFLMQSA